MRRFIWPPHQFLDIKFVGRSTVIAVDEEGKNVMFDRDDMAKDWAHLGMTPTRKEK